MSSGHLGDGRDDLPCPTNHRETNGGMGWVARESLMYCYLLLRTPFQLH